MKYSQARYGRVFVIRLEDGDILHFELLDSSAQRVYDKETGFKLL